MKNKMKIMLLNCQLFPWSLDYMKRKKRLLAFLLRSGADVICLTELWYGVSSFKQFLAPMYPYSVRSVVGGSKRFFSCLNCCMPSVWHGGLLILSKRAIERPRQLVFSAAAHADSLVSKGALKVSIEGVDILATHLQAHYTENALLAREIQIDELKEFLQGSERLILAGDLNIDTFKTPQTVSEVFEHLKMEELDIKKRLPTCADEFLDYFAARGLKGSYKVVKMPKPPLSDHSAILADINI